MKTLQRIYQNWLAHRQLEREINKKLMALTDPTFLDRALRG